MLLEPLRVLDCTGPLGWLAGRLLADLGADVIKIEPPGADFTAPDWRANNVNKRLLSLDFENEDGRQAFLRLADKADFVLETAHPGTELCAFFDPEKLRALNPGLIHVSITPFGRTGPRAEWLASDIELMAAGGAMSLAGEPDGQPLRVTAPQSNPWAASQAAVGAMVALTARAASGRGQHVDVSAQAAVIASIAHAPASWDLIGVNPLRAGAFMTGRSVHGANYRVFWPCKDGYLNFIIYGGVAGRRTNEGLVAWMKDSGAELGPLKEIDWATFDPTQATQEEVDALEEPIARFFLSVSKAEFLEQAFEREMLGYPVNNVADIAQDPQLEARGFWTDLPGPEGGTERHCGGFAVIDGERLPVALPVPEAGQHSREVLSEFGFGADEIALLIDSGTVDAP
ncbi:MAG TPA: CaiB/BaiF CoA-transferase family protein [Alphaproteobacteria bacterium]|nr:CaiB/BaiF CoA-transferase family protein [Alphaproteobacteria bacterium]